MSDGGDSFLGESFMPHGHCYFWRPDLLWLHVGSDALIALAYFSIPVALLYFIKKRPEPNLGNLFVMFAGFILLCGGTHLFAIVTVWEPYYYTSGFVKAATATVSAITAISLWGLMPLALKIPSPGELKKANDELMEENRQRDKAEAELRDLNEKLEAKVRQRTEELEQFVYAASHDLQEPLRQLRAYAEFLESDIGKDLPSDASEDLHFIHQASGNMSALVSSLLDLSRTSQEPLKTEWVPVRQCILAALDNLEATVTETGAQIAEPPDVTVKADPTLLTTVYQNLISNALKYAKGVPTVYFTCEDGEHEITLGVRDAGIGVSPDDTRKIFNPFVRLHSSSEVTGAGIGLSIARRIVERHDGRIWAEADPDGGAHFRFTLPRPRECADGE